MLQNIAVFVRRQVISRNTADTWPQALRNLWRPKWLAGVRSNKVFFFFLPSFSLTEILHGCYASPWSSRSCFCVLCGVLRCLCNWPFWRFVGAVVANQIEVVCFECNPPICHRDQNSWGFSLCFCCLLYICLPCLLYLQLLGHRALCQQRKGESGLVHFFCCTIWFPALVFGLNKSKYGSLLSRSKMRHDLC